MASLSIVQFHGIHTFYSTCNISVKFISSCYLKHFICFSPHSRHYPCAGFYFILFKFSDMVACHLTVEFNWKIPEWMKSCKLFNCLHTIELLLNQKTPDKNSPQKLLHKSFYGGSSSVRCVNMCDSGFNSIPWITSKFEFFFSRKRKTVAAVAIFGYRMLVL